MNMIRIFISGIFFTLFATGCATRQYAMDTNATHSIEFLYFDGCPNTPALRESLEASLDQAGGSFNSIDLTQLADDDIRRGYGSPTILVDGQDLFAMPAPTTPTMNCRVYPGGLPDTDTLIAKLTEITP